MLRGLVFVFGLLLLIPGPCALGFLALYGHELTRDDAAFTASLAVSCLAVTVGGVLMIRDAIRGGRRRGPPR